MPVVTHIEDLRVLAKQRVPRMFYDYADSGSWTESRTMAGANHIATADERAETRAIAPKSASVTTT